MKIQFSGVGQYKDLEIEWPEGWPLPRIDESITLEDGDSVYVRCIDYCPTGEDGSGPFVYIVVGPRNIHL